MLRSRVLASFLPLIMISLLAHEQSASNSQPCIAAADTAIEIAGQHSWPLPADAQRVSFTNDAASATVRVQIVDDPGAADFVVVDDVVMDDLVDGLATNGTNGCEAHGPTQRIAISQHAFAGQPVIYLSHEDGDYRVYVRSKSFTPQKAAALIVGAHTASQQTVLSSAL
jgi:hypothetical protein